MILQTIVALLALLSFALMLWQWWVARKFPLHQRVSDTSFAPAVTILKPLKGCDSETKSCLQSWSQQDYKGSAQILFGVASADDPVCDIVRQLLSENVKSSLAAELVICSESLGPNAKVSSLIQLQRKAQHEIIIVSDADVRVPADFLANIVAPLQKCEVGLVNCFYRYANPTTLAMHWEAIAVNADFWSQVLQSQSLKPIDFALGAVMATRREQLKAIGGFESLVDYLADDYQLGNRIAKTGKQIVISPVVVECWESPKTWKQVWNHQLRWARTIRACQPGPFFFSILSNATLWAALLSVQTPPSGWREFGLAAIWVVGFVRVKIAGDLQHRLNGSKTHSPALLVLLKDILGVYSWALSFFGNIVEWRGERFKVTGGGKLKKQ